MSDLHVLPLTKGHMPSRSCWCGPIVSSSFRLIEDGSAVVIHRFRGASDDPFRAEDRPPQRRSSWVLR